MSINVFYYAFGSKNAGGTVSSRLTVNENGTYQANSGRSYNPVIVNVQPNLQDKTVTANGTITADEGYDGLDEVTVAVPPQIKTLDEVPETKDTDIIIVSGIYYLWKEGVSA